MSNNSRGKEIGGFSEDDWSEQRIGVKILTSKAPAFSRKSVRLLPWSDWPEREEVMETIREIVEGPLVNATERQLEEWEEYYAFWDRGYEIFKVRHELEKKQKEGKESGKKGGKKNDVVRRPRNNKMKAINAEEEKALIDLLPDSEPLFDLPRCFALRCPEPNRSSSTLKEEEQGEEVFIPQDITHKGFTKAEKDKMLKEMRVKEELQVAALRDAPVKEGDFVMFLTRVDLPLKGMSVCVWSSR